MRRSSKAFTISVAILLTTFGVMTLASASTDNTTVLHLVLKVVQTTELDLGEQGMSQGDQVITAYDIFRQGKKVGSVGEVCTATRVTQPATEFACQASGRFPEGNLTAQTLFNTNQETVVYAITGGTGAYRDAGGFTRSRVTDSTTISATVFVKHLGS
jgi:hypothetical protein